VKHCDGGVCSIVTNHHDGGESLVFIVTLGRTGEKCRKMSAVHHFHMHRHVVQYVFESDRKAIPGESYQINKAVVIILFYVVFAFFILYFCQL